MNLIKLDVPLLCLILSFNILYPLTIETPSPAATFNIIERSTATGALLVATPQNLW